jgi:hypothetical protein
MVALIEVQQALAKIEKRTLLFVYGLLRAFFFSFGKFYFKGNHKGLPGRLMDMNLKIIRLDIFH